MVDETEKPKKKVRSIEERIEAQKAKVVQLEETQKNREVRKVWVSGFRAKKSELNNNKELNHIEKLQAFVDWVYEETDIFCDDNYEDENENEDEDQEEEAE